METICTIEIAGMDRLWLLFSYFTLNYHPELSAHSFGYYYRTSQLLYTPSSALSIWAATSCASTKMVLWEVFIFVDRSSKRKIPAYKPLLNTCSLDSTIFTPQIMTRLFCWPQLRTYRAWIASYNTQRRFWFVCRHYHLFRNVLVNFKNVVELAETVESNS